MSFHTPRSITMTESNPSSVDQYRIQMLSMDLATVYSDATYAADPDGSTTIPIGSNGSMNNLPVDENFRLRVIQMDNGVSSEAGWQGSPRTRQRDVGEPSAARRRRNHRHHAVGRWRACSTRASATAARRSPRHLDVRYRRRDSSSPPAGRFGGGCAAFSAADGSDALQNGRVRRERGRRRLRHQAHIGLRSPRHARAVCHVGAVRHLNCRQRAQGALVVVQDDDGLLLRAAPSRSMTGPTSNSGSNSPARRRSPSVSGRVTVATGALITTTGTITEFF